MRLPLIQAKPRGSLSYGKMKTSSKGRKREAWPRQPIEEARQKKGNRSGRGMYVPFTLIKFPPREVGEGGILKQSRTLGSLLPSCLLPGFVCRKL